MNKPKVRFKGYTGEWEEKKLGDFTDFKRGKGISKNDIQNNGQFKCIRYGELYTKYNGVINNVSSKTNKTHQLIKSIGNEVLIPSSGETSIDISTASALTEKDVIIGGDINILSSNILDNKYLSYLLFNKKQELAKYAQGISVMHLYNNQIKLLKIKLPCLEEQQKIGMLFKSIDQEIELLEENIELKKLNKKGLMQKIFNQEIRFSGYTGEWEEKKLSGLCLFMRSGGTPLTSNKSYYEGDIPFLSISDISNNTLNFTNKLISEEGLKNSSSKRIEKGNLIYTMYATPGVAFLTNINVAIPQSVISIELMEKYSKYYILTFLNYNKPKILKYAMTGTQSNLTSEIVKNLNVKLPSLEEQQKIGMLFKSLDEEIELLNEQLRLKKLNKKYYMQTMFC